MQRMKSKRSDRGSVAVITASVLVLVMAVAALAIDVSAAHSNRQQLQTGADAAALAVAQDCARNRCAEAPTTSDTMAKANIHDGVAQGTILQLDTAAGRVTVQAAKDNKHVFAPVLGIDSTLITARSSARWGYPTGGTAVLPLAFSWCELAQQTGVTIVKDASGKAIGVEIPSNTPEKTIYFTKSSGTTCTGPSNNFLAGGFGWLTPSATSCDKTSSVIGGWVGSDTGNNVPSICTPADFQKWLGQTVLLPIFDNYAEQGGNGRYQIFGYAAFTLKNYYFAGQYKTLNPPCGGDARCIYGSFDRFVDLTESFDYSPSGPRLGAAVVALTE